MKLPKFIRPHCAVLGHCRSTNRLTIEAAVASAAICFNLDKYVRGRYRTLAVEFREPEQSEINAKEVGVNSVNHWHQDGHQAPNLALVLWSNVSPTEFRGEDGAVFAPMPGSIILVRNSAFEHRIPTKLLPGRLFVRIAVQSPDWL